MVVLTTNIKNWKSISIMFGIPIILYLVISGPVFNKMKIEQTESAEFSQECSGGKGGTSYGSGTAGGCGR